MFKKHSPYAGKLKSLTRFEGLSDAEVQKIADKSTHVTLPANWSLMSENTPADKAYVILDGEVSVRRHGEEVATLGPGETIGEMAVVNHKLRSASVISTTPIEALHFTREDLEKLATDIPALGKALASTVHDREEHDHAQDDHQH